MQRTQSILLGWKGNRAKAMGLGYTELIIIVGIFLLAFGSKALPMIARNMGNSVQDLKADIGKELIKEETRLLQDEVQQIKESIQINDSESGKRH